MLDCSYAIRKWLSLRPGVSESDDVKRRTLTLPTCGMPSCVPAGHFLSLGFQAYLCPQVEPLLVQPYLLSRIESDLFTQKQRPRCKIIGITAGTLHSSSLKTLSRNSHQSLDLYTLREVVLGVVPSPRAGVAGAAGPREDQRCQSCCLAACHFLSLGFLFLLPCCC